MTPKSLEQWLIDAKIAGHITESTPRYHFSSNEEAAAATVTIVIDWLRAHAAEYFRTARVANDDTAGALYAVRADTCTQLADRIDMERRHR